MPEIDVKGYILNGPEMLMQNMAQLSTTERQETINFIKVLRTFILNTEVKAEISSFGASSSKVSGTIEWVGERKDGEKGIELFLRSRSGNKVFILGGNVEQALFNSSKRVLIITETPEQCPICKSGIATRAATIQCPSCGVKAHKDHFLEYLKIHGSCPKCGKRLSMKQKTSSNNQ
ncbi:MAG: hypothetical protein HWN66_10070 [Candidatus Helarchaeota archaeon]|nr:hypothetical protein [Candidatus Helarchaeota archaeon]